MPVVEDRLPLNLATSILPVPNSAPGCVRIGWVRDHFRALYILITPVRPGNCLKSQLNRMGKWGRGRYNDLPEVILFLSLTSNSSLLVTYLNYRASFPPDMQLKCCCDSHASLLNGCSINKVSIGNGTLGKCSYIIFFYCEVFNSSQTIPP